MQRSPIILLVLSFLLLSSVIKAQDALVIYVPFAGATVDMPCIRSAGSAVNWTICDNGAIIGGFFNPPVSFPACANPLSDYDYVFIQHTYKHLATNFQTELASYLQAGGSLFYQNDPGSGGLAEATTDINFLLNAIGQPPLTVTMDYTNDSVQIILNGNKCAGPYDISDFSTGGVFSGPALNDAYAVGNLSGIGNVWAFWNTGFGGVLGLCSEFASGGNNGTLVNCSEEAGRFIWDMMTQNLPDAIGYIDTLEVSICQGEVYFFNSVGYTNEGYYTDSFTTVGGCDSIMTLVLDVINSSLPTVVDATICEGQVYAVGSSTYNSSGSFVDTLLSRVNCDSIVQLNLNVITQTDTVLDIQMCEGQIVLVGDALYTQTGYYIDTLISAAGCDSIIYLTLDVDLPIELDERQPDTIFCEETEELLIELNYAGITEYSWNNGASGNTNSTSEAVEWVLTLTDTNGCVQLDTINVGTIVCDTICSIHLTTAFSPNGDGMNDEFKWLATGSTTDLISLSIYSRWGQKVYEGNDPEQGWNGRYQQNEQPIGTYTYVLRYRCNGNASEKSGYLVLVR